MYFYKKTLEMHFNKDLSMTGVNIVRKLATCPTCSHQSLQMGLFKKKKKRREKILCYKNSFPFSNIPFSTFINT